MPKLILSKISTPLATVIGISAALHVLALLIFGSLVIYSQLQSDKPEFEAPPVEPPIQEIKVNLKKLTQKPPPPISKLAVDNLSKMNAPKFDIHLPKVSERVTVGGYGGPGGGLGLNLDMSGMVIDFFGIKGDASRVAFVVDYSASMKEKVGGGTTRFELMKRELDHSISMLPEGIDVAVIFFSGPVWQATDDYSKEEERFTWNKGNYFSFRLKEGEQVRAPDWIKLTESKRRLILDRIQSTDMSPGTTWHLPLRHIFSLRPAPEVIFFLTDGATDEKDVNASLKLVEEWHHKHPGSKINTIALGEPRAEKGLKEISKMTDGTFRLVEGSK